MRFQISKGKDKIPLMITWSCMLFSFDFQEITVMPPSRHRVIPRIIGKAGPENYDVWGNVKKN